MKHRGEIVEKAVRQSGISITKLAGLIGYNRKTMYDFFANANLPVDIIMKIGKAIKYDFRKDFPDLFSMPEAREEAEIYGNTKALNECLKEKKEIERKYYAMLEENNQLKSELIKHMKK